MKILIVDDSLVDRLIVRRYMLSMSHEVILAEDGQQAISIFIEYDPDLVLLDVRMPKMDGYQVLKKLREIDHGWRPILFLSGAIDTKSYEKGIYAGGDDYLYKPIDRVVLKAKLHVMERLVAMRNELQDVSYKLSLEKEKIKMIANMDGLTGIANRRLLDSVLEQEFRRYKRLKNELSFIMIDIDYFKSFNDHFGHLAGDDALRLCAEKMSELVSRAGDLLARYGGEEFCLVLPNTSLGGALKIAETFRQEIEALNILRDGIEISTCLTISLGVSGLKPGQNHTVEDLIGAADKALYQAKFEGRNRVCSVEV